MINVNGINLKSNPRKIVSVGSSIRLKKREIDVLYDTLERLDYILRYVIKASYILVAGSLLGAIRSQSILFNDDDIDIAIVCPEHHAIVQNVLAEHVKDFAYFKNRPFPCCDRIRPKALSHLWIDIFYLRRYNSLCEIVKLVGMKDNGTRQPEDYVNRITDNIVKHFTGIEGFPIWHYDNRKAVELWPSEFFFDQELFLPNGDFTLSKSIAGQIIPSEVSSSPLLQFGHLLIPGPYKSVGYLMRSYGADCFEVFPVNVDHSMWVKEFQQRKLSGQIGDDQCLLTPLANISLSEISILEERHFLPLQHSKKAIQSTFNRCALIEYLTSLGVSK